MSPVIDNKIVQMDFDNQRFEKNVSQSISTLDKLKAALKLDGASKGLESFENSIKGFNLSSIGSAVENISNKFTLLGMIGVTAMQRIATAAVDAGEKIVKSMTVDQISAGWDKYAEKTKSVQTIMSATGETWKQDADRVAALNSLMAEGMNKETAQQYADVWQSYSQGALTAESAAQKLNVTQEQFLASINKMAAYDGSQMDYVNEQMSKLNWFTDETSYSFTDMVGNIGKFTANQIPLSEAATAMQGIATWAAAAGQGPAEASRAMYNLSQAIGVGAVKLQDWKSIENANMATAQFKGQVLETAAAMGVLQKSEDGVYTTTKGTEVSIQSFSSTLSEGWFNKDILVSVLGEYGNFTNELYELSSATDLTATDILELVEAQEKGQLTTAQLNEAAAEAGISTEELRKKIESLASDENKLGRESFRAAQQALTFSDAIEATKDAASTGWMNIFENIFGDFERARHVWTDFANFLYDTLVSPLEKIQDLSEAFVPAIDTFGKSIANVSKSTGLSEGKIMDLVLAERNGTLSTEELAAAASEAGMDLEAFSDIIGDLAQEKYGKYIDALTEASDKTGLSRLYLDDLAKAYKDGTLSSEELAVAAKKAGLSIEDMGKIIEDLASEGATSGLDRIVSGLKSIFDYLLNGGEGVFDRGILGSLREGFERVIPPLEITQDTVINLINTFQEWAESLTLTGEQMSMFRKAGQGLASVLLYIWNSIKNFWSATAEVRSAIVELASAVGELVLNLLGSQKDIDTSGAKFEGLGSVCSEVAETIRNIAEAVKNFDLGPIKQAASTLSSIFSAIGNSLMNFWNATAGLRTAIFDIVSAIGELIFKLLGSSTEIETSGIKFEAFGTICDMVAGFVTKIADAIRKLDVDKLKEKFSGLTGVITAVSDAFRWLVDKISNFSFSDTIGKAIDWIKEKFNALKEFLSGFDWGNIFKGLAGGGVLALIGKKLLDAFTGGGLFGDIKEKITGIFDGISDAIGAFEASVKTDSLKKIAESILILAAALLVLGFVDYNNAIIGITAIAGIMFGLYEAFKSMSAIDSKKIASAAAAMLVAAAAMLVLAVALGVLAGAVALFALAAKMEKIGEGLMIMIITLAVVVTAMEIMSHMSPKVLIAAAALAIMAAALLILAAALAAFALVAKMDTIAEGLLYMAATLAIVIVALMALSTAALGALGAAAALLIVSAALLVLAGALAAFALIAGMENAWTGLSMLVIVLALLTIALLALGATAPAVLVGAAALLVAAAACLLLAVAVAAAGVALPLLALGLMALGAAIESALTNIGEGIQSFLVSISEALIVVGDAIAEIVVSLATGLGEAVAALGTGIGEAIAAIGTGLGEAISALGTGIGDAITEIVSSVGRGIAEGITAISDSIGTFGENLTKASEGITNFGNSIRSLEGISWTSTALGIGEIALALGKLKAENLATTLGGASDAVVKACTDMIAAIQSAFPQVMTAGEQFGENLIRGVQSKQSGAEQAAKATSDSAAAALQGTYGSWYSAGGYLGDGFASGIWSRYGAVSAAASALAAAAASALAMAAQIASPSKVTTRFGQYWGEGFIKGIHSREAGAETAAESMMNTTISALANAKRIISDVLEDDFTPVITPVLNTDLVENGLAGISGINPSIGIGNAQKIGAVVSPSVAASQNGTGPVTAVLSDSAIMALARNQTMQAPPVIEFTGDLAQLARVLHPVLVEENNNHGISLIKR